MAWGSSSKGLVWSKKRKQYENSTRTCTFNPETMVGYSYEAKIFQVLKGVNVFNWTSYSVTTSSHQWLLSCLLKKLNIKIDYTLHNASIIWMNEAELTGTLKLWTENMLYKIEKSKLKGKYSSTKDKVYNSSYDKDKIDELKKTFKIELNSVELDYIKEVIKHRIDTEIKMKDNRSNTLKALKTSKFVDIRYNIVPADLLNKVRKVTSTFYYINWCEMVKINKELFELETGFKGVKLIDKFHIEISKDDTLDEFSKDLNDYLRLKHSKTKVNNAVGEWVNEN